MTMIKDLHDFHTKYEFNKEPMTIDKLLFRHDLLSEEMGELMTAISQRNAEETVDALIDLIYIAVGTLDLLQVDTQKAWDQVQQANMTKIRGVKPGREQSGGFDVIKPADWKAPSHVGNHGILEKIYGE